MSGFAEAANSLEASLNAIDDAADDISVDDNTGDDTPPTVTDDSADDASADDKPVDDGNQNANVDDVDVTPTPNQGVTPEDLEGLFNKIREELNKPNVQDPQPTNTEGNDDNKVDGDPNPADDLMKKAEEIRGLSEDELRDKFFENPTEMLDTLVNAGIQEKLGELMPKLEPIIKDSEDRAKEEADKETATQYVNEFAEKTPDFKEYAQDVAKILQDEKMGLDPKSLEIAYWKAKSQRTTEPDANKKTLEEFLGDEESLKQLIGNEKLQGEIVSQYLKGVAGGNEPMSISNGDGSSPVGNGVSKPKSFKEASELLIRQFQ